MKSRLLFFYLLLSISSVVNCQIVINDSTENNLKKNIDDFKSAINSPSVVVAIVHGDNIIFEYATGLSDIENNIPATVETKYPIMSVTKTFTATMYMRLYEKGFVGINDDIRKYIPEYNVVSDIPDHQKTTLFQLATHTSGLPRNSPVDIEYFSAEDRWFAGGFVGNTIGFPSKNKFLESLDTVKLQYKPYEYMYPNDRHYSNMGYSLLGISIERASKVAFEDYIVDSICNPLYMYNTGFLEDSYMTIDFAKGYIYKNEGKDFIQAPLLKIDSSNAIYPGGMYSTVRDMAKYISFQLQEDNEIHDRVLSKSSRAMMQKFNISWRPSYPYTTHEGAILGYRCNFILNPDLKLGWIILTNTSSVSFSNIDKALSKILFPLVEKQEDKTPELKEYAGKYKLLGGYGETELTYKNDKLYSNYLDDVILNNVLIQIDKNSFKVEGENDYDVYYKFNMDKDMNITSLNLGPFIWYKE